MRLGRLFVEIFINNKGNVLEKYTKLCYNMGRMKNVK